MTVADFRFGVRVPSDIPGMPVEIDVHSFNRLNDSIYSGLDKLVAPNGVQISDLIATGSGEVEICQRK